MVIDSFLFFNELDLLEIRLNILDKYVDKFVIVECTETFMGKPKPLYFKENQDRYAQWKDKIVHYVVDKIDPEILESAKRSPNVGAGEHFWVREFCQKESMIKALDFCKDDDTVFVSDLDEIWNPDLWIGVVGDNIFKCKQTAYHYYLNNRSDQDIGGWVGTHFGTYKTLDRYGINHFRNRGNNPILLENGGWHFTFMGGEEAIKTKVEAYSHQEYNTPEVKCMIKGKMFMNEDFANRGFKLWVDESQLPKYLIENKQKWIKMFR